MLEKPRGSLTVFARGGRAGSVSCRGRVHPGHATGVNEGDSAAERAVYDTTVELLTHELGIAGSDEVINPEAS